MKHCNQIRQIKNYWCYRSDQKLLSTIFSTKWNKCNFIDMLINYYWMSICLFAEKKSKFKSNREAGMGLWNTGFYILLRGECGQCRVDIFRTTSQHVCYSGWYQDSSFKNTGPGDWWLVYNKFEPIMMLVRFTEQKSSPPQLLISCQAMMMKIENCSSSVRCGRRLDHSKLEVTIIDLILRH